MKTWKLGLALLLFTVTLCGLSLIATAGDAPKVKLYFIINSGACPCQREDCQMAKPIAGFVQTHLAAGVEYQELDYGTRPDSIDPLMRQYKIFAFPAFLAVDANKTELLKLQGTMKREDVLKKLFEKGLITGVN
jgi:hypothetical protein